MASAAILILSSCGNNNTDAGEKNIDSVIWKLESMNGEKSKAFEKDDSFTLQFIAADSSIAGKGACNRFMGRYKLEPKGALDIQMGGSTRMACPDMDMEQPYFIMLEQADKYKIENGKLMLYKGKSPVAVFIKYDAVPNTHTAENSTDISGTYKGTLPAADGPGIKTELTLNKDNTYLLKTEYIDRDSKFSEKGTYSVKDGLLTLTHDDNSTTLYKIGENSLDMLDADGNEVTGPMAGMYILRK